MQKGAFLVFNINIIKYILYIYMIWLCSAVKYIKYFSPPKFKKSLISSIFPVQVKPWQTPINASKNNTKFTSMNS